MSRFDLVFLCLIAWLCPKPRTRPWWHNARPYSDVQAQIYDYFTPNWMRTPSAEVYHGLTCVTQPRGGSPDSWPTLVRFTETAAIVTLDPLCGMSKNDSHRKRWKVWRRWGSR